MRGRACPERSRRMESLEPLLVIHPFNLSTCITGILPPAWGQDRGRGLVAIPGWKGRVSNPPAPRSHYQAVGARHASPLLQSKTGWLLDTSQLSAGILLVLRINNTHHDRISTRRRMDFIIYCLHPAKRGRQHGRLDRLGRYHQSCLSAAINAPLRE